MTDSPAAAPPTAPPTAHDRPAPLSGPLGATLARAVRQRASQPLLQRVGETKIGHDALQSAATPEARTYWLAALKELRDTRKARKAKWEEQLKEDLDTEEGIDQRDIMGRYPAMLMLDKDVIAALKRTAPFRRPQRGDPALVLEADGPDRHLVLDNSNGEPVASVVVGAAAYVPGKKTAGGRATFTRNGKQYVADNRGAPTRRYAYVEKNVFQLMDLFATGSMTGRYQMFHTALGITADIYEAGEKLGQDVTGRANFRRGEKLTLEQLGVLHQWKGSGQEQRGLSLTSTPREDAVYSNRGGSFRSTGGVRIQIDLVNVPANVVLLNHYGDFGIKEELGGVNPSLQTGTTYGYINSVIKNRELYLERLEMPWISKMTVHTPEGDWSAAKNSAEVATKVGYSEYAAGFSLGARNLKASSESPMHLLGHGVGLEYRQGYLAGQRAYPVEPPPVQQRGRGGRNVPPPRPRPHRGPNWGALKTEAFGAQEAYEAKTGPERHAIYWIGWAHGGSNRALATTLKSALS